MLDERQIQTNRRVIAAWGVPFEENDDGTVMMFRQPGRPAADFYPTRNRWRCGQEFWWGHAADFIEWFEIMNHWRCRAIGIPFVPVQAAEGTAEDQERCLTNRRQK